jgi:hypothetical protein
VPGSGTREESCILADGYVEGGGTDSTAAVRRSVGEPPGVFVKLTSRHRGDEKGYFTKRSGSVYV